MGDLVIEGKPLEKLIDVVSNAIGELCAPWQIERIAKAEAKAESIKAIERAKTEALIIGDDSKYNKLSVIEQRIVTKERKRQSNIENVVYIAAGTIKNEPEVSSNPVSSDWATRFFDIAQDVSDEAMQDLWGRILAGEVKQPNSYSLRTLDALRNITSEEAELFEKAAQYVLYDGDYFLYNFPSNMDGKAPLEYMDVAHLIEIGLVQSGLTATQNYFYRGNDAPLHNIFYAEQYVAFIDIPSKANEISFPIYPLTKVGSELYKLTTVKPDIAFFEQVLQSILDKNIRNSKEISIMYARLHWIDYSLKQLEYDEDSIKKITSKLAVSK